nr:CAP domain-containing protein [Mesorhizobium sp. WSM4875]
MIAGIRGRMTSLTTDSPHLDRRTLLKTVGLAALGGIAACTSVQLPTGEAAGVSSSATGTLSTIRTSAGLPALIPDAQLEQAALQQAGYMASRARMSHTTGWGKDFASRMKGNGVRGAAGENIAEGRFDLQKLFDIWMHSDGHRRNMLDPDFSRFGLAYVRDGRDPSLRYWALVLGR